MKSAVASMNTEPTPAFERTVTAGSLMERCKGPLFLMEPWAQSGVLLAARLLYGGLFVQTGWGKLTHLDRTGEFFESLGLPAPMLFAGIVGGVELAGGLLLAMGLKARYAAAALTGVMVAALFTAHAQEAFESISAFTEQAPFPFLAAALTILAFGAGRITFDRALAARKARHPGGRCVASPSIDGGEPG